MTLTDTSPFVTAERQGISALKGPTHDLAPGDRLIPEQLTHSIHSELRYEEKSSESSDSL